MRYEDYKVEDMVFTTKEDWTEEEMKEFLDTCLECKDNEGSIYALFELQKAIEDGIVKVNSLNDINKQSAKAYVKDKAYIYYGGGFRYTDEKRLYVILDGERWEIPDIYTIKRILNNYNNIEKRFRFIIQKYEKKEKEYATKKKMAEYTEKYADRIILSRKAAAWLDDFRLEVPIGIEKKEWSPEYYAERKRFSGSNYYHTNDYGELTFFDYPITEDEAKKIIEVISEASRKVSLIMDRCKVELDEIYEKYRDMCKERSDKDEK